ncbi:MAG: hypothetical protein LC772_06605 [Chloroflexi bacterium]|nr:hypothetical protein [Chloroflexota bacterium]
MNEPYYAETCRRADHEESDGDIIPHWHCGRPYCPRAHRTEAGAARCRWVERASSYGHGKPGRPRKGEEPRVFVGARLDPDDAAWLKERGVSQTIEELVREKRLG